MQFARFIRNPSRSLFSPLPNEITPVACKDRRLFCLPRLKEFSDSGHLP